MKMIVQIPCDSGVFSLNPNFGNPIEVEVEVQLVDNIRVWKNPRSKYWIATNLTTGFVTNNADLDTAISQAKNP